MTAAMCATAMSARTGKQFLEGLRTRGREVRLGNERIVDVT